MEIFLDSAPENLVPELALRADRLIEGRWNGWLRPVATADAFGSFLDAWRRNDPNGQWGYVSAVGDVLVCSVPDSDEPSDEFPEVDARGDGTPLYDLTGWVWIGVETQSKEKP